MRVDVGEFEADTVVIGKTNEVSGVAGKELLFSVDPAVTELTFAASWSFVGFNEMKPLLSLEMTGRSSSRPRLAWRSSLSARLQPTKLRQ